MSWSIMSWVSSSPSIRTILVSLPGVYARASLLNAEVVMKTPFLEPVQGLFERGPRPLFRPCFTGK